MPAQAISLGTLRLAIRSKTTSTNKILIFDNLFQKEVYLCLATQNVLWKRHKPNNIT